MTKKLLATIFLFVTLASGQDTTCNAGDIAWVVETVVANIGTANAGAACLGTTAGAEYNNFAAPFGIQGALDCSCPGLDIRIVRGVDNYNSASASWTNRDAANRQLNTAISGTLANQTVISGWVDATTRGVATLDFDSGAVVGADGINGSVGGTNWVLRDLRITNTDDSAMDVGGYFVLYNVELDTNASTARLLQTNGSVTMIQSSIHDGGGDGIGNNPGKLYIVESEIYNNTGIGIVGFGNGSATPTVENALINTIVRNNGNHGVSMLSGGGAGGVGAPYVIGNTFDSNGGSGFVVNGNAVTQMGTFLSNNIFSRNARFGIEFTSVDANDSVTSLANNNYFNNTLGTISLGTARVIIDLDTASPDITDPNYTAPSLQPAAGTVDFTYTFPSGDTQSPETKGAAHSPSGAGAGANVAY